MERYQLTPERAELIINLLRNNPGIDMTLGDISDETGMSHEELAAHLADLVRREVLEQDVTPDGFDVYRFPADYQRGSMAPSN
jgi:DNA-binding IclR family transcriptional regulator